MLKAVVSIFFFISESCSEYQTGDDDICTCL